MVVAFVLITGAVTAVVLLLNVGGCRARLLSRITRVENWPVVVAPPPHFQPTVPPGFTVSILAKGFA
ncbi:MAG: hypothetical protein WCE52_04090, partial [Candidatus Acidiferrum sp.]